MMAEAAQTRSEDRKRVAEKVMELAQRSGEEVTLATLASDGVLSRRRLTELFENDDDLFEAVVELWFEPHIAIMEEVIASDLPANRKMYEFYVRRFRVNRERYRRDPISFAQICESGAARFENVRGFVDLADHYLCEIIAQAQVDGFFSGLEIDQALSLLNQMVSPYTMPESLIYIDDKLSEEKLAQIIDTIFAGLSAEDGGARGVNRLRLADSETRAGTP